MDFHALPWPKYNGRYSGTFGIMSSRLINLQVQLEDSSEIQLVDILVPQKYQQILECLEAQNFKETGPTLSTKFLRITYFVIWTCYSHLKHDSPIRHGNAYEGITTTRTWFTSVLRKQTDRRQTGSKSCTGSCNPLKKVHTYAEFIYYWPPALISKLILDYPNLLLLCLLGDEVFF